MTIDIITPTEKLFSGTAKRINLPGSKGSFEILENHAPIVSTLAAGNVVMGEAVSKFTPYSPLELE